jgi:hypothetical protein
MKTTRRKKESKQLTHKEVLAMSVRGGGFAPSHIKEDRYRGNVVIHMQAWSWITATR